MIEVALQTSASDTIAALNLVISGVAALVALLVLWFTALKGPDIRVVSSHTKVEYQEPPRADLSLTRIEFQPVDIVFANNGSRSGALIQILTTFKPSKGFEPFFLQVWVNAELRSDKSPDPALQLPVVIPDRGTLVVTLKTGFLVRSWKDATKLGETQGDIAGALKTIWKEGHTSLKRFSEFNKPIGTLEISVRKTSRKRLRTAIGDSVVSKLEAPPLPQWITEEARKYLTKFSDVYPPDDQAAAFIRQALDLILTDATSNSRLLSSTALPGSVQQLGLQGWERWFCTWRTNYGDQTYRAVITRNRPLFQRITDYYEAVLKYNRRVTAGGVQELSLLKDIIIDLKKASDELIVELQTYQRTLFEATAHLLPIA